MAVSSQTKETILVADDEASIRRILETRLSMIGYKVVTACDGKEALKLFKDYDPDLVVLDVMMPKLDGYGVCQELRKDSDVPIVMLTALGDVADRITGLELGADDYVVKPFSVRELALRVSTVLKRREKQEETSKITLGDIEINLSSYRVFISDTEIQLTAKEFLLFKHLVQKNGRIQPREVLLEEVWGYNPSVTTRTVDTHVKRLRSKIGDIGSKIETVRGVGYRFNYVV